MASQVSAVCCATYFLPAETAATNHASDECQQNQVSCPVSFFHMVLFFGLPCPFRSVGGSMIYQSVHDRLSFLAWFQFQTGLHPMWPLWHWAPNSSKEVMTRTVHWERALHTYYSWSLDWAPGQFQSQVHLCLYQATSHSFCRKIHISLSEVAQVLDVTYERKFFWSKPFFIHSYLQPAAHGGVINGLGSSIWIGILLFTVSHNIFPCSVRWPRNLGSREVVAATCCPTYVITLEPYFPGNPKTLVLILARKQIQISVCLTMHDQKPLRKLWNWSTFRPIVHHTTSMTALLILNTESNLI